MGGWPGPSPPLATACLGTAPLAAVPLAAAPLTGVPPAAVPLATAPLATLPHFQACFLLILPGFPTGPAQPSYVGGACGLPFCLTVCANLV